MRKYVLVLFIACWSPCFSQTLTLKFDKTIPKGLDIIIAAYNQTSLNHFKTITRGKSDSVVISVPHTGLYSISIAQSVSAGEFIASTTEKTKIEITYSDIVNGILTIKKSRENISYSDLQKINSVYDTYLDSLHRARMVIPVSSSRYYERCAEIDSAFETIAREKNSRLTSLQFYYMNTFTAKYLVPFYLVPVASGEERKIRQTPYAYISTQYFKFIRPGFVPLKHFALYDFITRYFNTYTETSLEGAKSSVNQVMRVFKTDTSVQNSVTRYLVQYFINQQIPELAWYTLGVKSFCALKWPNGNTDMIANWIHVQKGNIVEDIVMNDNFGKPVSLNQLCKKSKKTALVFWTDNCKQTDSLLSVLLKSKIPVFAVYIGNQSDYWKTMTKKYNAKNWVHVCEFKPTEASTLIPRFVVAGTPTVYWLNTSRQVQERY